MGIDYSASVGVFAIFAQNPPVYETLDTGSCCANDACCNYKQHVDTKYCGSCGSYVSRVSEKVRSDQTVEEFLEEKGYVCYPESHKGFDYYCLHCLESFDLKRDNNLFYEIPEDRSKIITIALEENKKLLGDLEVYYGNKPKIVMAMYCDVG